MLIKHEHPLRGVSELRLKKDYIMLTDFTIRRMSLRFPFQGLQLPIVFTVFCSSGDDKRLFVAAAIKPIDCFEEMVRKISNWLDQPHDVIAAVLLDYMERAAFEMDLPPTDAGDDDDIPF